MEKGLAPGERRDASAGDLGASPSPVTGPGETIAAVPSDRMLQIAEAADDHDGKGKHEASGLVVFADVDFGRSA